ncbi:hypothetical protein, partial [Okeania sp. SIO2G5]|uniref:hypothetical protein n=1 Tax=Okeania sp. SIO2G5 TaxID=2607796 RepID=UPI002580C052
LDTFQYAIVHGNEYCSIVTKQHHGYVAVIVTQRMFQLQAQPIIDWLKTIHPCLFAETSHLVKA